MRAKNASGQPTGAIATFMCSILQAWAPPMTTQDTIANLLIANTKRTMGGLVYNAQSAMLDVNNNSSGREVMQTWILFGDASLMVRSKTPIAFAMEPPNLPSGESSYTVSTGGANDLVSVYRPDTNTLVASGYTNAGGSVTLNVASIANVDCTLKLTVSRFNAVSFTADIQRGEYIPPDLTINPTFYNFDPLYINEISPNQIFTVTNTGENTFTVNSVTKTGTNASDFSINVLGLPWSLSVGASQTFTVSFAPTSTGYKSAEINIASNANGSPHTINLFGTATSPGLPLPYTQNFNGGTDLSAISWGGDLNTYSGIKAGFGVSNSNALAMNVYGSSTSQSAYTPTIAYITADTNLSFAYKIRPYSSDTAYALTANDKAFVEVSTNGGSTYSTVLEINTTNHTNSASFATKQVSLSAYNNQHINIRFWATRSAGDWYFVLDDVSVTGTPNPPATLPPLNLVAIPGNNNVSLSWNAPAEGTPQGYKVYRGETALSSTITELTYTDNTAINGNQYSYHVSAIYAGGTESATEPVSVTLDNITAPAGLTATVLMYDVTLTWDARNPLSLEGKGGLLATPTEGAWVNGRADSPPLRKADTINDVPTDDLTRSFLGYNVYQGTTFLTSQPINEHTYTHQNVTPGTYTYKVSAVFSNGESTQIEIENVSIYDIQPPSELQATIPAPLTVALAWTPPTSTDGFTHYQLYKQTGEAGDFEPLSETLDAPEYTDSGLENMTTYSYKVTAVYVSGESTPTSTVSATPSVAFNPVNDMQCVVGFASVALTWTAPETVSNSATLDGYRLMREETVPHTSSGSPTVRWETVLLANLSADTFEYTDETAENGQTYIYSMIALYTEPEGESTSTDHYVQMKIFNPPLELSTLAGDAQVTLNWNTPTMHDHLATLSGYKIYRNNVLLPAGIITDRNEMSFIDTEVENDNTYTYCIVAIYSDPAGESEPSNIASATPLTDFDGVTAPVATTLTGNYPNPFNPETTIRFSMAREDRVSIDIYSINGQLVCSLVSGSYGVGIHNAIWNGRDNIGRPVSSGVYFYRMTTGEYSAVRKMLLLK